MERPRPRLSAAESDPIGVAVSPRFPTPVELKNLPFQELETVAEEIRHLIIQTCLKNGGHLGASLGAVEIAIALHRIFESPSDAIFWDVGHQAYAHKLLTGRGDVFSTLRQFGGMSGFLSREESEHDVWGAGHSSTALSAALASAWAKGREGSERWTVAVVGDGGLTAGLALEALNNVKACPIGRLLVLLNDNQMSIAPNVGAISKILSDGTAGSFFGLFGFDYIGPIDGHDLHHLVGALGGIHSSDSASDSGRPILLHVLTQKGKGYAPAEERPESFHGVSPVSSGTRLRSLNWSEKFGEVICELAATNPKLVAITAAMPEGTGLQAFAKRFPERFFDVGIAEPHAVTFAAGLATQGYLPVVAIYSTFLQRAYDSVIHDVALQRLPVCFAIDRAGWVGADGATHHGTFDLSFLSPVPGFQLFSPAVYDDLTSVLSWWAAEGWKQGPCAIRYPRGGGTQSLPGMQKASHDGYRELHSDPSAERFIVALGSTWGKAMSASAEWTRRAIPHSVLSLIRSKPVPLSLIERLRENPTARIIVLEEGSRIGGFADRLRDELGSSGVESWGYPDEFVPHGSVDQLERHMRISAQDLAKL